MWKKLLCLLMLAQASVGAWGASDRSFPNRPIRILDGFSAGGGTDYLARLLASKIKDVFGYTVVVDNRPGAASTLAADLTAHAVPDGYTLFITIGSILASSPSLYSKLPYDPIKDFSYISLVATGAPVMVAHPSLPVKTVSDLVALARSKPGQIKYGSAGVGSPIHLTMEYLQSYTGMRLLHVPYKGGALSAAAAASGEVQLSFASVTASLPLIQGHRVNPIAVSSRKRLAILPNVPTVAESGFPKWEVIDNYGIVAPAKTPAAIVNQLNADLRKTLQMDDVKAKFAEQGLAATGSTPQEFAAIVKAEVALWTRVIKDAGIKPQM